MADRGAVWVTSELLPDGRYITSISVNPDRAFTLDRDAARRYAATVFTAVAYAEYDTAVVRQLQAIGIALPDAAGFVVDLRADRPPLDDDATAPLRFEPLVAGTTLTPAVHIALDGELFCQWDPADARQHAGHVLDVAAAVDLDAAYRRLLVAQVGLDDARARAVVGDLAEHWDTADE